MIRLLLILALAAVCLALLLAIAPFLLIVALAILVLAWRKPSTVERVSSSRRLAALPAPVRSTPMRFAASLVAVTFTLSAAGAAVAGNDSDRPLTSTSTPRPELASRSDASAAPSPTLSSTPEPTLRATPSPTPKATPVFGHEPAGPTQVGTVVEIIDGDTIAVDIEGEVFRVRYIGMDTPETQSGYEWMGAEASAANADLVAGREVVLEKDVSETDQYGRLLRYVWIEDGSGWLLVNLELIRLGFASITTYPPDVKYVDALYVAAQDRAQAAGLGLWSATPTPVPTTAPIQPFVPQTNCHPSYPDVCIPPAPPDLNCGDIPFRMFRVLPPDPHNFDGEGDGWGCEG